MVLVQINISLLSFIITAMYFKWQWFDINDGIFIMVFCYFLPKKYDIERLTAFCKQKGVSESGYSWKWLPKSAHLGFLFNNTLWYTFLSVSQYRTEKDGVITTRIERRTRVLDEELEEEEDYDQVIYIYIYYCLICRGFSMSISRLFWINNYFYKFWTSYNDLFLRENNRFLIVGAARRYHAGNGHESRHDRWKDRDTHEDGGTLRGHSKLQSRLNDDKKLTPVAKAN